MPAPYDLTGRTAIVTGSSTGNGRAIATSLAEAGVNSELALHENSHCSAHILDFFITVVGVDLHPRQPKVSALLCVLYFRVVLIRLFLQGFEENEPLTIDLVREKYKIKSAFVQGDASKEETWHNAVAAALEINGRIDM